MKQKVKKLVKRASAGTNRAKKKLTNKPSSSSSRIASLLVGAAIGAGVALLTAPRSGKKTRKMLGAKAKQLKGKAEDTIESAQEYIKKR